MRTELASWLAADPDLRVCVCVWKDIAMDKLFKVGRLSFGKRKWVSFITH